MLRSLERPAAPALATASSAVAYYVADEVGGSTGPFTIAQLARLSPIARVWRHGMNGWCVAGDVPELAVVLAGPPPATVLPGNSPGVPLTVHSQAMAMARQQPELAPLVYCTLGALALLAVSTFLPIVSVLFFSFSAVNFWWGKLMLLAAIGCGAWLFTTMKPAALLATAGFLAASTAVALHLMIRMVTPEDLPETFATGLVSVGAGIYLALIAGAGGLVCAAKLYLRCQPALPHEPRPSGSLLGWIIAAGVAAHWLLFL